MQKYTRQCECGHPPRWQREQPETARFLVISLSDDGEVWDETLEEHEPTGDGSEWKCLQCDELYDEDAFAELPLVPMSDE